MGDSNDEIVLARDGNVTASSAPDTAQQKKKPYEVICISIYEADLRELDRKVADLKARGVRKANRSWLIRRALAGLDLDALELLAKGARL